MSKLSGKTLFITGASRGIGRAIALRAAADGANIVIAAKTSEPHPKLPGTIHSVAEEVNAAGGKALAIALDIRDEVAVNQAVATAVETFGGIDILVNNASAINVTSLKDTAPKRLDLMLDVNMRGTYICSQACARVLAKADNPHILVMSPPISMQPRWFEHHTAYTLSKYGMSLCAFGLAAELKPFGIAVNALWPKTVIATAALAMLGGKVSADNCRKPEIVADAAHAILTKNSREFSANFCIDEDILRDTGIDDFSKYAVKSGAPLLPDLFLDEPAV